MRLAEREKREILSAVRHFDESAHVFLFGSRADDSKKGGDIDLLVLSAKIGRSERRQILQTLYDAIGEQKIDIVIAADAEEPFARMALGSGVPIQ